MVNNIHLLAPMMAQVQGTADAERRSSDELVREAVADYLRKVSPKVSQTGPAEPFVESLVQQERRERHARSR